MKKILSALLLTVLLSSCTVFTPTQRIYDPTKVILEYQATSDLIQLTEAASTKLTQNPSTSCEYINGLYENTLVENAILTISQTGCVILGSINTNSYFEGTWISDGYFTVIIERQFDDCELKLFGRLYSHSNGIRLLIDGTNASCSYPYNYSEDTVWVYQNMAARNVSGNNFEVLANIKWQNTGIVVHKGDAVMINYVEGKWQTRMDGPMVGPEGDPNWAFIPPGYTMPDQPIMSLIAKIGDNQPFLVVSGNEFIATSTGKLWLSSNDSVHDDNIGSIIVNIIILS